MAINARDFCYCQKNSLEYGTILLLSQYSNNVVAAYWNNWFLKSFGN